METPICVFHWTSICMSFLLKLQSRIVKLRIPGWQNHAFCKGRCKTCPDISVRPISWMVLSKNRLYMAIPNRSKYRYCVPHFFDGTQFQSNRRVSTESLLSNVNALDTLELERTWLLVSFTWLEHCISKASKNRTTFCPISHPTWCSWSQTLIPWQLCCFVSPKICSYNISHQ